MKLNQPMSISKKVKRFLDQIEFTDSCWIWKGSVIISGYG